MLFSFLDLVLFTGIVQGIFLIFSLQFIFRKNRVANRILTVIIGLATFIFAGKMALFQITVEWIWRPALLSDCSIYLFGPLLYMYFRALVFKESPKNILTFKHCIPSLLLFLFFCWTLTLTMEEYTMMTYSIGMQITYLIMELTGLISLIVYTTLSYKIMQKIKKSEKYFSVYESKITRYMQFILIGFCIIILFWAFGIFRTYIMHSYDSYIIYKLVWISMSTFLFIVGYFSFTQPEVIRLPVEKMSSKKDRLNKKEIEEITNKLQFLIAEKQIYMRSDLSLKILAKKVDTSANNLSWLLNSVYGKTFYEFINEYRVKAFLEKVKEGEHKKQTILGIAMDAGFNSKSTFNKSFKMMMNDTPSRYIEKNFS
ncbi:helix-turn-helix domain-containing protein [uncultured Kordia sp.]|uniref:helix-turn-helix domain-containing protein n=1 Tax=uncultured Kordia sp. TaxID=507699 RepID=UPI00261C1823|nr:helix-turn-helix domain-containing protein [uncultured Kordia sp.]